MADQRRVLARMFSWDTAAIILRIVLAAVFIHHGGEKMFGWFGGKGWETTVGDCQGMGIPRPLAMAVPITEFVGACCIAVGLLARFWSAGLAIVMINAIAMVHFKQGWARSEFQLCLLAMSLAVFLGGPGRWALADLEGRLLGLPWPGGNKVK